MSKYFLGIDIGTQGARVVLMSDAGTIAGQSEAVFVLNERSRQEQSPELWWKHCQDCIKEIRTKATGIDWNQLVAVGVTSTSGTVIPLDEQHQPLHDAIMYSDPRSGEEGKRCTAAAASSPHGGQQIFGASTGLAKMVWYVTNFPEQLPRLARWVHAADYITGKLSGRWDMTDYTNAYKSGYDVTNFEWPEYLFAELPLKKEWLPDVVPSGTVMGTIDPAVAEDLGLPATLQVTVGLTDGCASQVASGAINPGDWNTTIGTTMVIKGVTEKEVVDAQGRIYSHRHPAGYWMPGGASNTGADWVTNEFGSNLAHFNEAAAKLMPTSLISYPLRQQGERFPMMAPGAQGFEPEGISAEEKFTANLEGVAYLERYAYELISHLSGEKVRAVYTAGGGSSSAVWLRIRSNVLNLPIIKMREVSGAVGAAISAASFTGFGSIMEAVAAMTSKEVEVHPEPELSAYYNQQYKRFLQEMEARNYIKSTEIYA